MPLLKINICAWFWFELDISQLTYFTDTEEIRLLESCLLLKIVPHLMHTEIDGTMEVVIIIQDLIGYPIRPTLEFQLPMKVPSEIYS